MGTLWGLGRGVGGFWEWLWSFFEKWSLNVGRMFAGCFAYVGNQWVSGGLGWRVTGRLGEWMGPLGLAGGK